MSSPRVHPDNRRPKLQATSYPLREDSGLECSSCRNLFESSEILVLEACGHNVCAECMEDAEERGKYICPVCMEATSVNGGPEPILELSNEDDKENSDDGEKSGGNTSRHTYITEPEPDDSSRLTVRRTHPPDHVREMKPFCFMHSKDKEYYCLDCDVPMCPVCASGDQHSRFHRMRDLGEVVAILRQNMAYAKECIDGELREAMRQIIQHEENYRRHLPKKLDSLKKMVEKQAQEVVRQVEEVKVRTQEELQHYASLADRVMHKRLAKMNRQLNTAKKESLRLADSFEVSEAEAIKMHARMHDFFIKKRERNFSSFFIQNRAAPDFNVMATVSLDKVLPKELTESIKRHVGCAIEGPPAIVSDTRRTPQYPLMQKGFPVPKSDFPKYLNETKKIILEWRKFAQSH